MSCVSGSESPTAPWSPWRLNWLNWSSSSWNSRTRSVRSSQTSSRTRERFEIWCPALTCREHEPRTGSVLLHTAHTGRLLFHGVRLCLALCKGVGRKHRDVGGTNQLALFISPRRLKVPSVNTWICSERKKKKKKHSCTVLLPSLRFAHMVWNRCLLTVILMLYMFYNWDVQICLKK